MEQTRLLSRFTKELVLCYDNDNAGKIATDRALEILNNSEFSVKVLQLPRRLVDGEHVKQDADDFIKFQGPDAFERLLNGSENGIEFRMAQVAGQVRPQPDDEARVAYCEEVSDLLAALPNAGGAGDLHHPGGGGRPHHPGGHEAGGPAGLPAAAGPGASGRSCGGT